MREEDEIDRESGSAVLAEDNILVQVNNKGKRIISEVQSGCNIQSKM